MAMTIDAWQKELHHEQIVLDKIIAALKRKKDFVNAEKLQKVRSRLTVLAYQPLMGLGGYTSQPQAISGSGQEPMLMMEYMYGMMRNIGRNNFDLLIDTLGHSDNAAKLIMIVRKIGRNNFSSLMGYLAKLTKEQLRCLMTFLMTQLIGGGGMTMEGERSNAEVVLEKDEIDCPCGSVTQVNAKIVNTGSVKDSFTVEFSEGGIDSNLVIEAWSESGKTTPELAPRESYNFVINIKPACSAYGVSQVGLSDRIRITVESVLEEVDKDTVYLRVNVK